MPRYQVTMSNGYTFNIEAASKGEARDRVHGRVAGAIRQAEREYGSNSSQAKRARLAAKKPFTVEEA